MSNAVIADHDLDQTGAPLPPSDVHAEQSVLGAMMLSTAAIGEVTEILPVGDFYRPSHAVIYEAICDLYAANHPTEPSAVGRELQRRGELIRLGGLPYLHTLIATVPTAANVAYYAEKVMEKAVLRRAAEAGLRITQLAYLGVQGDEEIGEVLDRAQAALDSVVDGRTADTGYSTFAELCAPGLTALDDLQAGRIDPGLSTGFLDLDAIITGLRPGQLVVVAGRPGTGKSTLAVDVVRFASLRKDHTSAVFSLEMSKAELFERIISAEARVRTTDMRTVGALTQADLDRINDAVIRILGAGGHRLLVDDTSTMTVSQIRAKARRIKARHGRLDLIVVDYLQLMTASGRRPENRQQEVSEISRGLKVLAKELEVPVIALSQLNRAVEQRADKRPVLADLRESGALEQDADLVLMLHRPELYEDDSPRRGEADLILAKHRGGPTATITVAAQLHFSRFADMARP